ncbi:MAG: alcohol dehydrogenase catalytic domain-containing protein, partial [Thermoproteota archaeon]|nr:alcohol dehydrogenase catalytic domain-containing protein [Thermoproteota archaeon]
MKVCGYAAQHSKASLAPFKFDRREPRIHDIVIDIQYCGICHSDIHQVNNEWGGRSLYPMVPGHEITGIVSDLGTKVTKFKKGDRVGVGCFVDSCRKCDPCTRGLEQYCLEGATLTYNDEEADADGKK